MRDDLIAKLVWDGGDQIHLPKEMGTPRADQLVGTVGEQLCEVGGRVCYDSCGKGRPSFSYEEDGKKVEGFHDHIASVKHRSVNEHYPVTVSFDVQNSLAEIVGMRIRAMQGACSNRPDVLSFFGRTHADGHLRVTANLRSIIEFDDWTKNLYDDEYSDMAWCQVVSWHLRQAGHDLAPHIVPAPGPAPGAVAESTRSRIVPPINDHERWISLFMAGSRGYSHEQVRHGNFTAISQRSTRYVDEADSSWVEHPLVTAWRQGQTPETLEESFLGLNPAEPVAKEQYRYCVATLEPWLVARGVDKLSARKQARGAARGYLGNALYTEMLFSASVAQWRWMLRQRASAAADAEIREVYAYALPVLKSSRYGDRFAKFQPAPSPDGIGMIAVEN